MDSVIEIFRTGRHTAIDGRALSFGERDLDTIATGYDPSVHEAPAVIGHPELDAPAYGWVKSVARKGDRLTASFGELDPQFADQLKAGRYKKISAAFYEPDAPSNPAPGQWYLRHVGFLGAQPPSVKGLRQAQFAEDEGYVAFAQGNGVTRFLPASVVNLIRRTVREEISGVIEPTTPAAAFSEEEDMTVQTAAQREADLVSREQALKTKETELTARETGVKTKEAAFSESEKARLKTADTAFLAELEKNGQSLPAWRPTLMAFMERMHGGAGIAFGEGDDKAEMPMVEAFHELLGRLPKAVEFAEIARAPADRAQLKGVAPMIIPPGMKVDAEELALRDRIVAYAEENKIDFAEAAIRIGSQA
jgi:hypothetical protein